eukprot:14048350-Alexandrium_andersonii.AAC.1
MALNSNKRESAHANKHMTSEHLDVQQSCYAKHQDAKRVEPSCSGLTRGGNPASLDSRRN